MGGTASPIDQLYREAAGRLTALGLPERFTLTRLHRAVEDYRGRQVHLIGKDLPALAPHGVWIATERADYVFYDRAAGTVRQYQIIGHEFGHMLFYDDNVPAQPHELAAMMSPEPRLMVLRALQRRAGYADPVERRAEVLGTVVTQRIAQWVSVVDPMGADPEVVARLAAALEPRERPC